MTVEPFNHHHETEFYALVTFREDSKTEEMNEKWLAHIHEQLGHPGQNKMEIMPKEAGLLIDIVKLCLNKIYKLCAHVSFMLNQSPGQK